MSVSSVDNSFANWDDLPIDGLDELDRKNLKGCLAICQKVQASVERWLILVNVQAQKMYLLEKDRGVVASYAVSTAANGAGQEEGSGKTPLGLHAIQEKFGDGAHPYAIFRSRENTEEIAELNKGGRPIVARILWLAGLEKGYNQGKNEQGIVVDSHDRYIYIHGTNDVDRIGQPVSGGCISLRPADVIELFAKVDSHTPVYIYQA